ncbi:MAG TPA: glycosyltransferase, partial [Alphaproteobacteria bacterium]|nr:glycosyltransferase [Alphaproteobacteria bacterium]
MGQTPLKYGDLKIQPSARPESRPGTTELRASRGRKRVVFVLPTLLAGGAERVLITLMNGLDRRTFVPELVVLSERGPLRDWVAPDTPVHSLGNVRVRGSLVKLTRTLNEISPDIVVSTMAAMNYAVLMVKPFLKKKPRLIVREAVVPSSIAENQRTPWLVRKAYQTLYPGADLVLSPAQCIIDEFESYLGMPTKYHVSLPNPVDIARLRRGAPQELFAAGERPATTRFICAGRLHEQKGFDRLIAAQAQADGARLITALPRMAHGNWTLNILGVGEQQETLQKLISSLGLQDKVTLDGLIKNPWPQIGAADCFLLPSRWEGLPNVVLESLACGTPVIGMDEAGGIAEIAALAGDKSVKIVRSMDEMIWAMSLVEPAPAETFRPSLLPTHFHLDSVNARFAALLEGRDAAVNETEEITEEVSFAAPLRVPPLSSGPAVSAP